MAKKAELFVCFYEDMERGFGFSYSDKNDFSDFDFDNGVLVEKFEKEIQNTTTGKSSAMATRFVNFADTMKGYIEFLRFFAGLGSFVSDNIGREALSDFLVKNGTVIEERQNQKIFRLPAQKKVDLLKIRELLKSSKIVGREIPQMLLMGIVSSFEHQMSLLAKIIIDNNPKIILTKDKSVSLLEVLEASSLEDVKSRYIEKEVENIFREGTERQIEWFEQKVGISDIRKNHKNIDEFLEVFERRNIYAHNNGIINDIYLSKVSKKIIEKNNLEKGNYIFVDSVYFHNSLDFIIEFGVKLITVCWRKIDPSESGISDSLLSSLCFDLILSGEYRLAKYLVSFARDLRGDRSDIINRIFIVNHASVCKLLSEEKEALSILDSVDWSASAVNFQCCVAAIRGDVMEVTSMMKRIGKNGEISALEYQEWPVFYHVRDDDEFKKTFRSIFGVDYISSAIKKGGIINALGGIAIGVARAKDQPKKSEEAKKILLRSVN
ncbi:hypothetical protein GCM10010924_05810 [Rhizobium wenxiniae]|uniref:Uncharacterized protein n=1 Tax=Rhizobium wenxiniae TaxID=1737357 RepID=A0A7W9Y1Z5_9HYPH|nr:hypothetical protein [Rhizobium wenxiniae]MBB6160430.1 hypothetical protein [Rhizobium wenxiniae]GGF81458.1 hypothetical protein GCM10010924_05810 [Rhizobium wenxiniae]